MNEESPGWDRALTKYIYVWLWSILLGANTSVGFTFLEYRSGHWGVLGLGIVLVMAVGAISIIGSLVALFRFLFGYLLPVFFANVEAEELHRERAGRRLAESFKFLIWAVVARLLVTGIDLTLTSIR